jgi:hypothetical protein
MDALAVMRRERVSLSEAARRAGTPPASVQRWAGSALDRRDGRYVPKPRDRLYRLMRFYKPNGHFYIEVKDSRTATKIARYHAAIDHSRATGDRSGLREFEGKYVQAGKQRFPYITDARTLDRLDGAGELSFHSIYQLAA